MRITVKRSEQGYRCGDSHQNAKASDAIVRWARDLYDYEQVKPTEIMRRLLVEKGLLVPLRTIEDWVAMRSRNTTPREREERAPTHRTLR